MNNLYIPMGAGKGILPLGEGYYTFPGKVIYLSGKGNIPFRGMVPYYSGNRSVPFPESFRTIPPTAHTPSRIPSEAGGARKGRVGASLGSFSGHRLDGLGK